jgi:hypothetical protein
MAEHVSSGSHSNDMDAHRGTYEGFIRGSVVLAIVCGYILVALVSFRFAHTLNVFTGAVGLILGIAAVAIDSRTGGRWLLSAGLLVLFGLVTAINVS